MSVVTRLVTTITMSFIFSQFALGQSSIYTCKDASGKNFTSDRPIPECVNRAVRVLNPHTSVIQDLPPPLTPDQQVQKEQDDKRHELEEKAAREQRRRDIALLKTYPNEESIEVARQRAVADVEDTLKQSRTRLEKLFKDQQSLQEEREAAGGKSATPLLARKIEDNAGDIEAEKSLINQRQAELERINRHFTESKRRFVELMSDQAK